MGVTFEEAESLKISQSQGSEIPEETRTFMNMALDFVTEEIRNSIDFYAATANGLTLTRAYYTGGASLTAGLIEHLTDNLKKDIKIAALKSAGKDLNTTNTLATNN